MWTPRGPTTPDREKTLQGLLDALTRPNKWTAAPPTLPGLASVTDNLHQNTTWTADVMNVNGINNTSIDAVVTQLARDGVTVSPTLPGGNDTGKESANFWYQYGISVTVAILVFVVTVVLIIQCRILYQKRIRRRRLVDFSRTNKARDEIFESFHRQATAESMLRSRLQSASTHEDIPMRVLQDTQPGHQWRAPPVGRSAEPLARVFPLHREPARDVNANITDPFCCESYRRLWNTTTGLYPIRTHRTVLSEPVIARPTSGRYSARSRVRKVQVRGDSRLPRLARYNLSGARIVTSPESNVIRGMRNRSARRNRATFADANSTTLFMEVNSPKLVVPTNTPNTHCTDSAPENASPYGPGLDSDFGASAGFPHFTVSPDNSMNVTDASLRDATYEWDTYDPAYMNRTVSYVDGAYFPVLHKKQYWV